MKTISELVEPSIDASDYNSREKRDFFVKSYLQTQFLEKACQGNCYYFVGEKGSGKTALAFHIQSTHPCGISSKVLSISGTQYKRFIDLKIKEKLLYTDYSIIWRATILYLMANFVVEKKKKWIHKITGKFKNVESAISQYDKSSCIPELEYIEEFVTTLTRNSSLSTKIPECVNAGIEEHGSQSKKTTQVQIKSALLESEKVLKTGLADLRFSESVVLFIDGLDAKPSGVDNQEYENCLAGLAEAAWHLNSEFFSNIKDSFGKMRVVLLLRPDVFDILNIHNSNCKLSDNSVVFHWHTTMDHFKESNLFKVSDRYFTSQCGKEYGWNHFFSEKNERAKAFPVFLTNSFQRPRDVFAAIKILIEIYKRNGRGGEKSFSRNFIQSSEFVDIYSEYLLGEVKNYTNFYLKNSEFDTLVSFFQYINGAREFDYTDFIGAFDSFKADMTNSDIINSKYLYSPEAMLQFWYDVNVIGYKEEPADGSGGFYHWSFRERSNAKIMPKVKVGCKYRIHDGVAKSLNIGKKFIPSRKKR